MATTRAHLAALNATIPTAEIVIKGVGVVKVRSLTAGERDSWEQYVYNSRKPNEAVKNLRASLVVRAIVDDVGARIYGDTAEDMEEVSSLPAKVVDRIYRAAQKLSGLGADDIDELEKI